MHEHEIDPEGRQICSTTGEAPSKVRAEQTEPTGQHKAYIVLCEEERAKGFVRPYRDSYKHVGPAGPKDPLRDLTEEQQALFGGNGYVKFEAALVSEDGNTKTYGPSGRFWTQADLDAVGKGCGSVTTMGRALSETYARDPKFYGATFCCACNRHLPVAEFVWTADGETVGS